MFELFANHVILQLKLLKETGFDKGTNDETTIVDLDSDSKKLSGTCDSKLVNFSEFVNLCYYENVQSFSN